MSHRSIGVIKKQGQEYIVYSRKKNGQEEDRHIEADFEEEVRWEVQPSVRGRVVVIPPEGFSPSPAEERTIGNNRWFVSTAPQSAPIAGPPYTYSVTVDGVAARGAKKEAADRTPPTIIMPP